MLKKGLIAVYVLAIVVLAFLLTAPYLFPEWRDWFPEDGRNQLAHVEPGVFAEVLAESDETVIFLIGDGTSELTATFQAHLDEAMQDHMDLHVFHFDATHPDVAAEEFAFVMEALEIAALPVVVQLQDGDVVASHTQFDGGSVADLSAFLGGLVQD